MALLLTLLATQRLFCDNCFELSSYNLIYVYYLGIDNIYCHLLLSKYNVFSGTLPTLLLLCHSFFDSRTCTVVIVAYASVLIELTS